MRVAKHPVTRAPFVVAIAAQPGGGKSTVAKQLVRMIPRACFVAYDAFQQVTRLSVAELEAWEASGSDCDRFDLSALERELERLKRSDASLIVLETPLGRDHRGTARFIDHLVWLDTPFDIALARALQAIIAGRFRAESPAGEMRRWLDSYLSTYQHLLWRLYRHQSERVRAGADAVVTGMEEPGAIADDIVDYLTRRGVLSAGDDDAGVEGQ